MRNIKNIYGGYFSYCLRNLGLVLRLGIELELGLGRVWLQGLGIESNVITAIRGVHYDFGLGMVPNESSLRTINTVKIYYVTDFVIVFELGWK